MKAQVERINYRVECHDQNDEEGGQYHVVCGASLRIPELLPEHTSLFLLSCWRRCHASPLSLVTEQPRRSRQCTAGLRHLPLSDDLRQLLLQRLGGLLRGDVTFQRSVELLGHLKRHV